MSPRLPQDVPSWAPDIIITCIVGPIVSAVIVFIRVWTRIFVTRNLGPDDYAAMVTLFFCLAFSVVLGVSTRFGMGLHLKDMTPELLSDHSEWMYISSVMYLLSIYGYRLALLLMYLRLFGVSKPFRVAVFVVMAFVTGYLASNFLTLLFGCTPVSKYWRPEQPGHCIVLNQADYAYGSMNVASDVLLFLLPLPMVWQLNLTRKEKLGLFLIFMSGIANCAVTTLRFALLVVNLNAPDAPWLDARTFLLTVVEINTGLICGCTPVLKPFFRYLFSKDPLLLHHHPHHSSSRRHHRSSSQIQQQHHSHSQHRYYAANRCHSGGSTIHWMSSASGGGGKFDEDHHHHYDAGVGLRGERCVYGDFLELEREEMGMGMVIVHAGKN